MKSLHAIQRALVSALTPAHNSNKEYRHTTKLRGMTVMIVAALSLVAIYGPAHSSAGTIADEIHYTITGPNSVSFDWRGDPTTINYGLTTSYGSSVTASGPVVVKESGASVAITPNSGSGPFREARLTGLQAGATYHYSIGGSADQTFRTAPVAGTAGFTAVAEGDTGNPQGFSANQTIQNLIGAQNPNLVISVGDFSYANGSPAGGQLDAFYGDAAQGATKPGIMAWSLRAAFAPSWGNHEIDHANDNGTCTGDNLANHKARFDFANPKEDPIYSTYCNTGGGEDWYWFDYGNTRFIAYPEPWSDSWKTWNAKVDPVMAQAQSNANIKYIVTFGHRPAWSSGYHHGETALANFNATLHSKYSKFVLALNGHSHDYERTDPAQTGGVTHITTGGGGGGLENGSCSNGWEVVNGSCSKPSWSVARLMHYGFLKLTFTDTGISGQYICGPSGGESIVDSCTQGSVADSFAIGSPSTPPAAPSDTTPPSVSLSAPANNATVTGTTTVSASASDASGIKQVEFFNGNTSLGIDTTAPYSLSWDTTKTANGLHSISAVATDNSTNLNKTSTAAVSVTVNNVTGCTVPTATYGSATTQINVASAGTYHVWSRIKAPDTTNNSYYVQIGSGCAMVAGDSTSIPANTWTWVDYKDGTSSSKLDATFSTAGIQNVVLTGREPGVRVDRVLLIADTCVPTGTGDNCVNPPDTTAPTGVAITAPTGGSTVNGQVTITASAADNIGVSRVDFYDGTTLIGSSTNPVSGSATNGTWQFVWNASAATVGSHSLTAKATDGLNSTASAAVSVKILSSTAPVVSIVTPTSGSKVVGTVGITASATSNNTLTKAELYVNSQLKSTITSASSPYNFTWNTDGLTAGNYSLTVKAYDNAQPANVGTSPVTTVTIADSIAPSTPTNLAASIVSSKQINLTWSASTDNVGVTGYRILRNGVVIANTGATTSYSDTNVTANTTYAYSVIAFDAAGNVSAASNSTAVTTPVAADTTAPSAPTLTAAVASATQINLGWSASTDNVGVAKYIVKRTTSGVQTVLGETTALNYSDSSTQPATTYSYNVYAVDAAGNVSAASNSASATTPALPDTTAPSTPEDLTAVLVSTSQVNVFWTISTDNVRVASYEVQRNGIKVANVTGTSYGDATVVGGTTYTYTVTAIDAAGNRSTPASTKITIPVPAPSTEKNYVTNPGFESGLSNWKALESKTYASYGRTSDAHSGSYAAKITRKSTTGTITLNDSPDWLKPVPAGATSCTASAWVKTSKVNSRMVIRIRDYQGSKNVGIYATELYSPDTGWHRMTISAPIKSSRDDFDLNIYATRLAPGTSLTIDDIQETCK